MDHNVLKEEISSAKRYRELKNLELSISQMRYKIPVSLYTELNGRIKEKLLGFDFPDCNRSKISVIYTNGLKKPMKKEECHVAMSRGSRLSDYIFSHYSSVKDFEVEGVMEMEKNNDPVMVLSNLGGYEGSDEQTILSPSVLRERMDYLLKKVDNLEKVEKIYSETLPVIVRDINDLKAKIDTIINQIISKNR